MSCGEYRVTWPWPRKSCLPVLCTKHPCWPRFYYPGIPGELSNQRLLVAIKSWEKQDYFWHKTCYISYWHLLRNLKIPSKTKLRNLWFRTKYQYFELGFSWTTSFRTEFFFFGRKTFISNTYHSVWFWKTLLSKNGSNFWKPPDINM